MSGTRPGKAPRGGRRRAGLLWTAILACGSASDELPIPAAPEVSAGPFVVAEAPKAEAATAAESPDPPISHPPLDALLRAPSAGPPEPTGPPPIDLGTAPPDALPAAIGEPGTVDRMRRRLLLERRSESIGPAGPRQGTHTETDAGVRVPLDEAVSIEGGVRVDERAEPNRESERKSRPQLGVEVRF